MTEVSGLYIHVPFCSGKCPYCGFYSLSAPGLMTAWADGVAREIPLYRDRFRKVDTVYFGGGTPSLLPGDILGPLMDVIKTSFGILPDAEITMEANPEDVSPEWMKTAAGAGFNRVSLGAQSFSDAELGFLGRRHNARQTADAIGIIRSAGCQNLGIDLMYGLPGQDSGAWIKTLEHALTFRPEHLSCYQLTIEPGTGFERRATAEGWRLPDEEEAQALFIRTSEFLEDRGYVHYEISNFALGDDFRSRHNQKYWHHAPCLGLGPAAHSYRDGCRWWNVRSVRKYLTALREGTFPVDERECLTPEQMELEQICLGLRTREGIRRDLAYRQPRGPEIVRLMIANGLAAEAGERLRLTRAGLAVADRLALELSA